VTSLTRFDARMASKIQPPRKPWEYAPTTWPDGPFATDDPTELALVEAVARVAIDVRERREQEQLSRAALARRAGVSAHVIGNIESGSTWPEFIVLAAVADALRADWSLDPRDRRPRQPASSQSSPPEVP
jgi:ribosome-binding protein aMBF1 (putative translation factor)